MKIAIVSKSNKLGGGASKVAEDLTNLLNENGHFAHHYRRDIATGYTKNSTSVYGKWEKVAKRVYYKLRYIGFQELIPFELIHLLKEIKYKNYDIIHFHDLSTAISPFTLMYLSKRIPTVWTMHDCSAFTGGCIAPIDCIKYKQGCYFCPQKNVWPMEGKLDLAFLYLKLKKLLHTYNLNLISPSKWLVQKSSLNTVIQKNIHIIPNSVNTSVYLNQDKALMKKLLSIPPKQLTILITSHNIQDKKKGFNYALEVLKEIKHLNPYIIIVGKTDEKTNDLLKEFKFYNSGFILNYKQLNKLYSSADIFLNCSLADNFPLVVLETMASGTPTFGFETGGIPEMIQQCFNGFLVKQKDIKTLSNKIEEVYINNQLQQYSINSRKIAEERYNHHIFLKKQLQYYKSTIDKFKKITE